VLKGKGVTSMCVIGTSPCSYLAHPVRYIGAYPEENIRDSIQKEQQ
jgi:hypothetical protein